MENYSGGVYIISLFSITWKDRLSVLRKMRFKELCRMRRSSKKVEQFVDKHSRKIRALAAGSLIISPQSAQYVNILYSTTNPAVFIPLKDPIEQLQCARFGGIRLQLTTSSLPRLESILRSIQPNFDFLSFSCARAEDYPAQEALEIVKSMGLRFKRIFVGVAKASFISSIPECCKVVYILSIEGEIANFHELSRFESVHIGVGRDLKANRKFVCYLQDMLTRGSDSLTDLRIYIRDSANPLSLDFLENVELHEIKWDEVSISSAVYLAKITITNQVAVMSLRFAYKICFVPNRPDDILLAIFSFFSALLEKVPLDLSTLYKQLVSLDINGYGPVIVDFIKQYKQNMI